MQGSKKTWIPACPLGKQLSHLLVCGHFLLLSMILMEDDLLGPGLPLDKKALK